MAAPVSTMWCRSLRNILVRFRTQNDIKNLHNPKYFSSGSCILKDNSDHTSPTRRDPGPVFLDERVQRLLYKVNDFNVDRIFRRRYKSDIEPPQYRLLTDTQLHQEQDKTIDRARSRVQMPPVMAAREDDQVEIISTDEEIAGHDTVKYVFTDITFGIKDRDRTMVVREPNGVLRTASPKERDRLQLVYLPPEGRMYRKPQMFEPEHFERLLGEERYEYVLERACVQFEPDDAEYIAVTQRTYEHIETNGAYDVLASTRHFGVMTFYYVFNQKLDGLLCHRIRQQEIPVAADLVRLYNIVHPECASASASVETTDDVQLIQNFIEHEARKKAELELALQSITRSQSKSAKA